MNWGKVTEVVRDSLKLVDLSNVKLWVEMHPNVVLSALLEVEDGAWSFTVVVSIIEEDEEVYLLRTKSTRSRGELDSTGGSFSLWPKKVMGTHGAIRENEGYSCMPLSRSFSRFSNSNLARV